MTELVVLVREDNTPIGTADKSEVHTNDTPLHRGFSLFVFDSKGRVLLTKRASTKKTFAGVWTNAVCGHPAPDESAEDAAVRRLRDELGITDVSVRLVADYRYRFADKNGIVENEICPVLMCTTDATPVPNMQEVDDWKWETWETFLADSAHQPGVYSPWCIEESRLISPLL